MFSLQNWIALYIHRHIQYRYNEMFHSATSVSIKCLHLVLETDHWSIDFTRDCPQLNCWSIISLMILSNCCSPQLCEYVYYIMQLCIFISYKVFCYYLIGASLQLGVQQLTELPEWTNHASTVHCTTVQHY